MLTPKTVTMHLERDSGTFTLMRNWDTDEVTLTETSEDGATRHLLTLNVDEAETLGEYLADITK